MKSKRQQVTGAELTNAPPHMAVTPTKKIRIENETNRSTISTQQSTRGRRAPHAAASAMGKQEKARESKANTNAKQYATSNILPISASVTCSTVRAATRAAPYHFLVHSTISSW